MLDRKAKLRAMAVCFVMALVYSVFSYRLIHLQIDQGQTFAALANQSQVFKQIIPAQRGSIRDVHGEVLASDMPLRKVVADGSHLKPDSFRRVTSLLASTLSIDESALAQKLTPERRYLVIKHQVPEQTAETLKSELEREKLHASISSRIPPGFIPMGPCSATSLDLLTSMVTAFRGSKKAWTDIWRAMLGYRYITRNRAGVELGPASRPGTGSEERQQRPAHHRPRFAKHRRA